MREHRGEIHENSIDVSKICKSLKALNLDTKAEFFFRFDKDNFGTIISPPKVLDPEDPGIGHLIGLMFHRAWTLKFISNNLTNPEDKKFLLNISKEHSHNGFEIMFDSGYGGEHWLATFAIYNFTR